MPFQILILDPDCTQAVETAYRSYANREHEAGREPVGMVAWAQENCSYALIDITEKVISGKIGNFSGVPPQVAMRGDNDDVTTA